MKPETVEDIEAEAPPGTHGMTYGDMRRLRVDGEGRLLWKGNLVQVQRRLTLSPWQIVATVAVGAAAQGVLAAYDLGTRLGWWRLGH